MNVPNNEELIRMDEVFQFHFKNRKHNIQNIDEELHLTNIEYKYYLKLIVESQNEYNLDLFKYEQSNSGTIKFNTFKVIECEKLIQNGGFLNFFNEKKQQQVKIERKENADLELLELNIKLTKFVIKTKYLPHFLSLLAFIVSFFALFK